MVRSPLNLISHYFIPIHFKCCGELKRANSTTKTKLHILISLMALSWTLPIKQKHARYPQIVTLRVAAFDKNITFSCVNTIKLLIPMWNVRRPPITIKSVLLMLIKSSMIWKEFFWCSGGVEEFERVNTTCSSAR